MNAEIPAVAPSRAGRARTTSNGRAAVAPLLLGAMVGALIAGRVETGTLCVAAALLGAVVAGAGRPARAWLGVVAGGAALSMVLNLFLVPGRALGPPIFWGLHPTVEGLRAGIVLALRLTGASLAVHGLRAAWPGERAADEAARLLWPLERLRVPVGEAHTVLGLSLRFAPLLAAESRRISRLQELRAGRAPKTWGERLERRRAAAVPTMVSALERAEWVSLALEARHYRVRPASSHPWMLAPTAAGAALASLALLWRG